MNQDLLALDHPEYKDKREIQVSQDSQEVLDLKEVQGHLVFQACQVYQGLKET